MRLASALPAAIYQGRPYRTWAGVQALHRAGVQKRAAPEYSTGDPADKPGQRSPAAEIARCAGPTAVPFHGRPSSGLLLLPRFWLVLYLVQLSRYYVTGQHPEFHVSTVGFGCLGQHWQPD